MTEREKQLARRRKLIIAESVLLAFGFALLGWVGYVTTERVLYSSWQEYSFEQNLQGSRTTPLGYLRYLARGGRTAERGEDEQPAADNAAPSGRARKLLPNETLGRIEIPRVNVSAVVKEGVDSKTLSRAVGHVPETALPGEKGNVGVAAHRDTFFRGLRTIREGDLIRMATSDGTYVYEVDSLRIVWPKNVEVLDPTPDKRITLVTCYPFNFVGNAPKRFIVQGKQIGFEQLSTQRSSKKALIEP